MTVEALRRHRPEVLDDLLERYGREIQGVAYLILRDRAAAEDVVADALLDRARARRPAADGDEASAVAAADRDQPGARGSAASSRVVQLHVVPDRAARQNDEDERLTLLSCVERLAPRTRAAVVLRYYADLSVQEIAEALGTSENTVKTQAPRGPGADALALAEDGKTPGGVPWLTSPIRGWRPACAQRSTTRPTPCRSRSRSPGTSRRLAGNEDRSGRGCASRARSSPPPPPSSSSS